MLKAKRLLICQSHDHATSFSFLVLIFLLRDHSMVQSDCTYIFRNRFRSKTYRRNWCCLLTFHLFSFLSLFLSFFKRKWLWNSNFDILSVIVILWYILLNKRCIIDFFKLLLTFTELIRLTHKLRSVVKLWIWVVPFRLGRLVKHLLFYIAHFDSRIFIFTLFVLLFLGFLIDRSASCRKIFHKLLRSYESKRSRFDSRKGIFKRFLVV